MKGGPNVERGDLQSLESVLSYLENIHEIEQLQYRYQHYLNLGKGHQIVDELFAQDTPDISMEAGDSGVFKGKEGVRRHFYPYDEIASEPGVYLEHRVIMPVIEIAEDGNTARGVWISPGNWANGKPPIQCWAYGRYWTEYIKEKGIWKIWHMIWDQTFESPYKEGWLNSSASTASTMRVLPWYPPDAPPSHFFPYNAGSMNSDFLMPPEAEEKKSHHTTKRG